MLEVEKRYQAPHFTFQKYEKIRIEQWCKKLCLVTQNLQWKKNRNLYCMLLLDQILNKKLLKPFIKMPPEDSLPMLSPAEVRAQLTDKFKKFQASMDSENAADKLLQEDNKYYSYQPPDKATASFKNKTTNTSLQQNQQRIKTDQYNSVAYSQTKNQNKVLTPRGQQTGVEDSAETKLKSIKSILKATQAQELKRKAQTSTGGINGKHNFQYSPVQTNKSGNKKSLRFDQNQDNTEEEDLERQISQDMHSFKIRMLQQEEGDAGNDRFQSTKVGEILNMGSMELQNQVIKIKTDNEILNITLRHLQEEMNLKSETIRKQNAEMNELRQIILTLQSENQRLKNQQQFSKQNYPEKENVQKVLSPRQEKIKKEFEKQSLNIERNYEQPKVEYQYKNKNVISPRYIETNDFFQRQDERMKEVLNDKPYSKTTTNPNSIDYNQQQLLSFDEQFNKIFNL